MDRAPLARARQFRCLFKWLEFGFSSPNLPRGHSV